MSPRDQEHFGSTQITGQSRRQQLEAARSRRYRQRQKAKTQGAVNKPDPRPSPRRQLQRGERVLSLTPPAPFGRASSSSYDLDSLNEGEADDLTHRLDV